MGDVAIVLNAHFCLILLVGFSVVAVPVSCLAHMFTLFYWILLVLSDSIRFMFTCHSLYLITMSSISIISLNLAN